MPIYFQGSNRNCLPCHSECRESCRGPTSYDCNSCMNFRVFADEHAGNLSNFSCTNECPKEFPHKVYNSEEDTLDKSVNTYSNAVYIEYGYET